MTMSTVTAKTTTNATSEAQIRELLDGWLQAVRDRDIKRIMSCYAPDVVAYDAIAALQFKGAEAYGKHWEACLSMCTGPMIFEIRELNIEAEDDVAFAHWLNCCGATDENGEEKSSWMRVTAGYRRIKGNWRIVHEHFSAPFDMATGKALFGLQP
jgi:uncharacterized protein (TIGR02246 family)